jgi:hypothetical protein
LTQRYTYPIPRPRRSRTRLFVIGLVAVFLAGSVTAAGAVFTNTLGAGERFASLIERIDLILDPPPDRETEPTVDSTPRPIAQATPTATTAPASLAPGESAPPTEPATPAPVRKKVDVRITKKAKSFFISQQTKDWCAPAGVQMTLALLGLEDNSEAFQHEIYSHTDEWESRRDSLNGGWGPGAMVKALKHYGARGYEIRAYRSRADALLDSARAISETNAPVILLAWRGAHTWVMSGYRATADPLKFDNVRVTGAYILDPWYPRVSSIWGPSDPAGTFQDAAEMRRNFLEWKRPEGRYPDRDGKYIIVVPTIHADEMG